ncbi:MAG: hypothetical protein SGARI_005883, partial [Bacillariaceae sp.]
MISYNSPIQRVIAQNNRAVSLLSSPEGYSTAISLMKAALSSLKRMAEESFPPPQNKMSDLSEPSRSFQGINDCMLGAMDECRPACSLDEDEDGDETPFIYRKALAIPMELGTSCNGVDSNRRQQSMVSCMVIFNLALAYHLSAVEETVKGDVPSTLRRALQLYELAFQLHCGGAELELEGECYSIHF